jgi:hypothetical protein
MRLLCIIPRQSILMHRFGAEDRLAIISPGWLFLVSLYGTNERWI